MRILTLNVCGIRASQKKGLFKWLAKQKIQKVTARVYEETDY